mgnify:CR=1 FL=1
MLTKEQVIEAGYTVLPNGGWFRLDPSIDPSGWDSLAENFGFDPSCKEVVLCVAAYKEVYEKTIRMRDDLAMEGLSIPASESFTDYDTQVNVVYVTAQELEGAEFGDDPAHPDDHPFTYLELADGRSLYFISADLDFD